MFKESIMIPQKNKKIRRKKLKHKKKRKKKVKMIHKIWRNLQTSKKFRKEKIKPTYSKNWIKKLKANIKKMKN